MGEKRIVWNSEYLDMIRIFWNSKNYIGNILIIRKLAQKEIISYIENSNNKNILAQRKKREIIVLYWLYIQNWYSDRVKIKQNNNFNIK